MAAYWQKYGLAKDPFNHDESDEPSFYPSRWSQYIDLMFHLSQQNKTILLVTGLSGSGKSTLMDIFFKQIDAQVGACKVHAGESVSPSVLEDLIIQHLAMPPKTAEPLSFIDRFRAHILRMHDVQDSFYLVIDDAHKLPRSSLSLLISLAEAQSDDIHPLHLILFGGPQLDALMADVAGHQFGDALMHTIRISAFSFDMVKAYLLYCLKRVGYEGEHLFTEQQILQVLDMSQGCIGKMNRVAQQVLSNLAFKDKTREKNTTPLTPKRPTAEKREKMTSRPSQRTPLSKEWLLIGLATVILVIVLVVFFFRTPVENQPVDTPVALPNQQNIETVYSTNEGNSDVNEQSIQETQSEDSDGLNGVIHAQKAPSPDTTKPVTQPVSQPVVSSMPAQNPTPVVPASAKENDIASTPLHQATAMPAVPQHKDNAPDLPSPLTPDNIQSEWIPLTKGQAATLTAVKPLPKQTVRLPTATPTLAPKALNTPQKITSESKLVPAVKNTPISLAADQRILMGMPSTHFTLQIAAASDYIKLKSFLATFGLSQKVYYFKTLNAGYPWYVAVYGDFETDAEAIKASKTLPLGLLQKEHPWTRTFENIHKAITHP